MSKKQKWLREGADIVVKDAFKDAQPGPDQKRATWSRDPNEVVLKFKFHNASFEVGGSSKDYRYAVVTDKGNAVYVDVHTFYTYSGLSLGYGGGLRKERIDLFKDPLGKRRPNPVEAEAYFDHWFRGEFGEGSK